MSNAEDFTKQFMGDMFGSGGKGPMQQQIKYANKVYYHWIPKSIHKICCCFVIVLHFVQSNQQIQSHLSSLAAKIDTNTDLLRYSDQKVYSLRPVILT